MGYHFSSGMGEGVGDPLSKGPCSSEARVRKIATKDFLRSRYQTADQLAQ